MTHVSDLEHRKIDATVHPDCIVEIHRVSDISRGLRKVPKIEVWLTERVLGRGTFGEVHLQVQDGKSECKRAIKVISTQGRMSDVECKRELTALLEFSKPKYKDEELFVHFLGWFQNEKAMYISMEYIALGDLEKNLQEFENSDINGGALSAEDLKDIIRNILEGIKIMHAEGFAHRDLKPQNVLVVQTKPKWWVKLGDFGLSKQMTEATALRSRAGTQSYMAPEMFHYVPGLNPESSEYTSAVDIWALGCIMYRIITGKPPFLDLWSLQRYCNSGEHLPPLSGSLVTLSTVEEDKFLRLLLMPNPHARPSAALALEHSWFITDGRHSAHTEAKVNREIAYSELAPKDSSHLLVDVKTLPEGIASEKPRQVSQVSRIDYNTDSHAGLHSDFQRAPGSSKLATLRPVEFSEPKKKVTIIPAEYPEADLVRMREPMPGAFDVDEFDFLGGRKAVKATGNRDSDRRIGKFRPEEAPGFSDKGWDDEKPQRVPSDEKRNAMEEKGELEYSPPPVYSQPEQPVRPSGVQNSAWGREEVIEPSRTSFLVSLWRKFVDSPSNNPDKSNDQYEVLFPVAAKANKVPAFPVFFDTFTGYEIKMLVNQYETIRAIKSRLSRTKGLSTEGLSPSGLRLNFGGLLLMDAYTIKGCGIEKGSRIDLRWNNV